MTIARWIIVFVIGGLLVLVPIVAFLTLGGSMDIEPPMSGEAAPDRFANFELEASPIATEAVIEDEPALRAVATQPPAMAGDFDATEAKAGLRPRRQSTTVSKPRAYETIATAEPTKKKRANEQGPAGVAETDTRGRRFREARLSADKTVDALADSLGEFDRFVGYGTDDDSGGSGGFTGGRRKIADRGILAPETSAIVDLPPAEFLPRKGYFENTYLGGRAGYLERVRRLDAALGQGSRPYADAFGLPQVFDPPASGAMTLDLSLDQRWIDRPGRVFLQIGLQGSQRFGWRRPPLDLVLVVDGPALGASSDATVDVVGELLRQLGPQDRLGVVLAGATPVVIAAPAPIRDLRTALAEAADALVAPPANDSDDLGRAMQRAGALLRIAAEQRQRIPGTQTLIVLTSGGDEIRAGAAATAGSALTEAGTVTSVIEIGGDAPSPWWRVAHNGHGNFHRIGEVDAKRAVHDELEALARVVARLLRVNVRLAGTVEAIRIVGTRLLNRDEVVAVKARELATDHNLSRTLGIEADRGDDDDGLQTVIPYFYGGDAHIILIELWVTKPGAVADVTLRYKDMVGLGNATIRASVELAHTPRPPTVEQHLVRRNLGSFEVAEGLGHAASAIEGHRRGEAIAVLRRARTGASAADRALTDAFERLIETPTDRRVVADALFLARDRRLGEFPTANASRSGR